MALLSWITRRRWTPLKDGIVRFFSLRPWWAFVSVAAATVLVGQLHVLGLLWATLALACSGRFYAAESRRQRVSEAPKPD
jgi:hypothetical protein